MKIVIEIDKDYFEIIKHEVEHGHDFKPYNLIANGTPLPEHHGDLIDRNNIEVLRIENLTRQYDKGFDAGVTCMVNRILDASTIIEGSESE